MKNFYGIKICIYLPFKYQNTFNNAIFEWFWTIFSLGAAVMVIQLIQWSLFIKVKVPKLPYLWAWRYNMNEKNVNNKKKILSECPQDWKRPTFWNEAEIYAWWLRRKLASCYWWSCDFAGEGIRTLKSGILCCGICKFWPRFLKGRLALIHH